MRRFFENRWAFAATVLAFAAAMMLGGATTDGALEPVFLGQVHSVSVDDPTIPPGPTCPPPGGEAVLTVSVDDPTIPPCPTCPPPGGEAVLTASVDDPTIPPCPTCPPGGGCAEAIGSAERPVRSA